MNRRGLICASLSMIPAGLGLMPRGAQAQTGAAPTLAPLNAAWQAWKAANLTADGRVVDAYQEGASHSESQGYGLYLATRFGDGDAFRRIYTWTESNLAIRGDGLLAWRWRAEATPPVEDLNNASDGDLFYAWALAAGAEPFGLPEARGRAAAIAAALDEVCLRPLPAEPGALLMLPGAEGFDRPEGVIFNPSYWMPRLMAELGTEFDRPRLVQAAEAAQRQLGTFAARGLAPDWALATEAGWQPPPATFSANAGYEAMRLPLYLCLSGQAGHPLVARFAAAYAAAMAGGDATPTVMDALTGAVQERSPHSGYAAIAGLARCAAPAAGTGLPIPLFTIDQPYYPATLHLFVLIAQLEGFPACVPI